MKPFYDYCSESVDDAHHTFFGYERWMEDRRALEAAIRKSVSPVIIVQTMLESENSWNAISIYISKNLSTKKLD